MFVDDKVYAVATGWKDVMLQRCGSVVCVDDVTRLFVKVSDPFGKLSGVGDGGGEEDVMNVVILIFYGL